VPTYTVSDAAAQLPTLLHRIENEDIPVQICMRDADNIVALLVSSRSHTGSESRTVSVSEARTQFSALVRYVNSGPGSIGPEVVITRHRKPVAILFAAGEPYMPEESPSALESTELALPGSSMSALPRKRTESAQPLTTDEVAAGLKRLFPGGKNGSGRPYDPQVRDLMYRIYGPVCLMGNHLSYRPEIFCAHIDNWHTTIDAYAASDWHRSHIEGVLTADHPHPLMVNTIHTDLGTWFNQIANVVPLCRLHHDRYDGRRLRGGHPVSREDVIHARDRVLLLEPVALNVMRELEAACHGRRSTKDRKPVILQDFADSDQFTLYRWASRAWRVGVFGDVDPLVRIGTWKLDLATDFAMESRGQVLDPTPPWWWKGWR
jgi:antitoxin (DNA-binding transcriptional repressor) of toxin-antitoxin stability system